MMFRFFLSFDCVFVSTCAAPKVYKSTSDYVTGLYNPKMATRCTKKDAGTSMHREQRLDLTEKYVYELYYFFVCDFECNQFKFNRFVFFLARSLDDVSFGFIFPFSTPLNGNMFSMSDTNHQPFQRQMNGNRLNLDVQLINGDVCDLTKQKEELVNHLAKQLVALTNERASITDQSTTNDTKLGTDISSVVAQKVRPSEASKFRSHVDDVGHITMLLLSLSGRLARIENSLFSTTDITEKVCTNVDRRSDGSIGHLLIIDFGFYFFLFLFLSHRKCWRGNEIVC